MDIRNLMRNRGWSWLFWAFLFLWYGWWTYILWMGFEWIDWKLQYLDQEFYRYLFLMIVTPWVVFIFMRLMRYAIENFIPENK